jgi:hypothetical protein
VAIVNSSSYSYGTNTYGSAAFGVDVLPAISNGTATATVNYDRIRANSASPASSASAVISNVKRIREIFAESSAVVTINATGVFSVVGNAQIQSSATVNFSFNRIRLTSGVTSLTSSIAAFGREKWERITPVNEVWTKIVS